MNMITESYGNAIFPLKQTAKVFHNAVKQCYIPIHNGKEFPLFHFSQCLCI